MSNDHRSPFDQDAVDAAAAQWVLRQDRGLTASEQDELSVWLAADIRHGTALSGARWGWEELDRLAGIQSSIQAVPDPDLLASPSRSRRRRARVIAVSFTLAAAAAIVVAFALSPRAWRAVPTVEPSLAFSRMNLSAPCERRTLEDGSVVELNRGAELEVAFTPEQRRVRLIRGEAHFTVTKNPDRPFIVSAHGVEARAVGTAFNVKLDSSEIEVLVTEGRVRVDATPGQPVLDHAFPAPVVEVGQRAVVPLVAGATTRAEVAPVSPSELAERLAWQPRLLDFNGAPLSQIAAAFNHHNRVRIVVGDTSLASLKLSAAFRSDNVAGFIRLMEADFGVRAEWRGDNEILLSRAH